jgi:beta-glucosidase
MSGLKDFRGKAVDLVAEMTIPEKAGLVSGFSMWETRAVERLGIVKADMADGPHGVRKQLDYYDIAVDESVKTVCFPTGCCIASGWDKDALFELGKALGNNAEKHNLSLLLGPGVNIKRSPLCGRNFEYFSEDPHLSGELGAAYIKGLQSTGVSASVKHFAANNQETHRLTVNAIIDERTLREIYLPAFEKCVTKAGVDVVMAAYNTLNGDSCTQNERLLTEVLREEWGFDGMVVSDWGAVTDDTAAIAAGTDLKMPGFERDPEKIAKAIADGVLTEEQLDKAAVNVTAFLLKAQREQANEGREEDLEANHALARKLAAESLVLLKNEGALPINRSKRLLIVGEFAKEPHFQGGGSSRVNAYKVDGTLNFLKNDGYDTVYFADFSDMDAILAAAENCDIAFVFAGTPEAEDSEGFDRTHINLPAEQDACITGLCKKIPTAVILFEGSVVAMPWVKDVNAVLSAYLPGEAGGAAVFDVLTGAVNPCGKLTETFARKLTDTNAYLYFPGINDTSLYGEGIFVGYRYFDKKEIEPLFPFGHGLSYTTFEYGAVKTNKTVYTDDERIIVSVDVTNTGDVEGKEVVQIYINPLKTERNVIRPVKELKAFQKVALIPGETKTLVFELGFRDFARYDADINRWRVDTGMYALLAASSCADIRAQAEITIQSTYVEDKTVTRETLMGEVWDIPTGRAFLSGVLETVKASGKTGEKPGDDAAYLRMVLAMPMKALILIGLPAEQVDGLIAELNAGREESSC